MWRMICVLVLVVVALSTAGAASHPHRPSEIWTPEQERAAGVIAEHVTTARPIDYVDVSDLPASFSWRDVEGTSFLTKSLNQHIPQCECDSAYNKLRDKRPTCCGNASNAGSLRSQPVYVVSHKLQIVVAAGRTVPSPPWQTV